MRGDMFKTELNYYAILGISSSATPAEITRAFRKKILQVHLDKRPQQKATNRNGCATDDDHDDGDGNVDLELCYKTIEANRVLSNRNLRARYDIHREPGAKGSAEEAFIPAGYITYDVGQSQLSKKILQKISGWRAEFESKSKSGSKDQSNPPLNNYFESFSRLTAQVLEQETNLATPPLATASYQCRVCDKTYLTEQHHWDLILCPYLNLFAATTTTPPGGGKADLAVLRAYFESLFSPEFFNWQPRHLVTTLSGIWSSALWQNFGHCDKLICKLLDQVHAQDDVLEDLEDQQNYIEENFLGFDGDVASDMLVNGQVFPSSEVAAAARVLSWVLGNQDDQVVIVRRAKELMTEDEDDLTDLMYLAALMRNELECGAEEWRELSCAALAEGDSNLAMLWTKVGAEFGDLEEFDWFKLGMKIWSGGAKAGNFELAHTCFLAGGYETTEDWQILRNEFVRRKQYLAAIEYDLNTSGFQIWPLLTKSREFSKSDPKAESAYLKCYYSMKVRPLLARLADAHAAAAPNFDEADMEELIQICLEVPSALLIPEGFKLIAKIWPAAFDEPSCHGLHRAVIRILRQSQTTKLNDQSLNLLLAAMHYLPPTEVAEEFEELLRWECEELTKDGIEQSLRSSDFGALTEILLSLTRRSLAGAEEVIQDLAPGDDEEFESQRARAQPHLEAMRLLISGTVHKVNKNWVGAMGDYLNALLSTPECSHAILPCVSRLSQDIEFHEAVLGQVKSEVKGLKGLFDAREYPQIEARIGDPTLTYPLLLTDVVPKTNFGYKDALAKIQATDPFKRTEQPPPPEEAEAPPPAPLETNTPLITLAKNQEAIECGQLAQLSAAMSYVDLLKALPLPFQPGPLVMAASHFLRAMDESERRDLGSLFAFKNAIHCMAQMMLGVERKTQASIQHSLTHKHMLSILLSAHEKLARALDENNAEKGNEDGAPSACVYACASVAPSDEALISTFLTSVVSFPKLVPLVNIPTLNCSDLVYVETLGNSFLTEFCCEKLNQKYETASLPKHLHAYAHFVEVWKGRSTRADFGTARYKAMEQLLASRGWTLNSVQDLMEFQMLALPEDGWSTESRTRCRQLRFPNPWKAYRSIHGFCIDLDLAKISFLLSRGEGDRDGGGAILKGNLFDTADIFEIFAHGLEKTCLTLESPDGGISHPFKEVKVQPMSSWCAPAPYLKTLTRAASLISWFSSGTEICSKRPFALRSTTEEGMLVGLEEHLQYILRPLSDRRKRDQDQEAEEFENPAPTRRFWELALTQIFEEEEEDEDTDSYTYKVGDVKVELRIGGSAFSPAEVEFARDFSRHFDEIGARFPELLRLKELAKISAICSQLKHILTQETLNVENPSEDCSSSSSEEEDRLQSSRLVLAIEQLGISMHKNETPYSKSKERCSWIPATFVQDQPSSDADHESGESLSVKVKMSPKILYGPVSTPPTMVSISAIELLGIPTHPHDGKS